eukprot:CAMPEP_0180114792 /NCGR_PEP_ID=MMETSP0985-20121206/37516_1 /TAXON_ID=483367 /ORGANISM="non described non described, Strain CCMP 2436" /LENGTH=54 /DNA_ID=CAMNT_0022053409 /DNA_START=15 /DNA_END=176 /DNA_ORIENTATION=+
MTPMAFRSSCERQAKAGVDAKRKQKQGKARTQSHDHPAPCEGAKGEHTSRQRAG